MGTMIDTKILKRLGGSFFLDTKFAMTELADIFRGEIKNLKPVG